MYDFLSMTIPQNCIMLFGRSIGTGPATHLAAHRKPCALLLMSPFKSIREIVKEQAGPLLQYVISDRFRNIDAIEKVRCPTFIVHGQKDTLISFRHSQELHARCGGPTALIMPRDMDHNEFDFIDDLIQPFHQFLKQCDISCDLEGAEGKKTRCRSARTGPRLFKFGMAEHQREGSLSAKTNIIIPKRKKSASDLGQFSFPEHLYTPPADFPTENTNGTLWNWVLRKFM